MTMKMSTKTAERLVARLLTELHNHAHRDEIIQLAIEQIMDGDEALRVEY